MSSTKSDIGKVFFLDFWLQLVHNKSTMDKEKKDKQVHIRFPESLHKQICDIAEGQERTMGEQVIFYLRRAIEAEDIEREGLRQYKLLDRPPEEAGADGREINGTDGIDNT